MISGLRAPAMAACSTTSALPTLRISGCICRRPRLARSPGRRRSGPATRAPARSFRPGPSGPGPLDIEDLAAQRQDRLVLAVAALLGRAAGGIALDDEDLGLGGVALLAIGELAGQRGEVQRALSPRQLARLARRLAGRRRRL